MFAIFALCAFAIRCSAGPWLQGATTTPIDFQTMFELTDQEFAECLIAKVDRTGPNTVGNIPKVRSTGAKKPQSFARRRTLLRCLSIAANGNCDRVAVTQNLLSGKAGNPQSVVDFRPDAVLSPIQITKL